MRDDADVLLRLAQQVEGAHQVLAREARAHLGQPRPLVFRQLALAGARRVDRQQHHVADDARELAADQLEVVSRLDGAVGERERARPVLGHHGVHHVEQQVAPDEPEHGRYVVHGHRLEHFEHDAAARQRPAFAIMDLRLANGSHGLDAAQQLYEKFGVRCIFVSANIDEDVRSKAAAYESLGYIGKPFLAAEVITAVQAAARATGTEGKRG